MQVSTRAIIGVFPNRKLDPKLLVMRVLAKPSALPPTNSPLVTIAVANKTCERLEPAENRETVSEPKPMKRNRRQSSLGHAKTSFARARPWLDDAQSDAWQGSQRRERQSTFTNPRRGSGMMRK